MINVTSFRDGAPFETLSRVRGRHTPACSMGVRGGSPLGPDGALSMTTSSIDAHSRSPPYLSCKTEWEPRMCGRRAFLHAAAVAVALIAPASSLAAPVAVKHWEGLAHGFVSLRTLEGVRLADGDLVQTTTPTAGGNRVTARLSLRFKDGSLHEETTVYLQQKTFQFVSNHLVQKGPAFKTQIEATVLASGKVRIHFTDKDGKEDRIEEQLKLPTDVANGMILALLKNISSETSKTTVSMVAFTPKPRLVKLEITPHEQDPFSTGGSARKATRYVLKVDVPGVTGAVASLLGKIPPDSHVWVLGGEAPAFVKAELALFTDGPTWRMEMLSPVWPSPAPAGAESSEGNESSHTAR
jgi:hypothetical protein